MPLLTAICDANIQLPVDYHMFGRSFDGLHYQYLAPIRTYYPDDYERIRIFFPLIDLEFARMRFRDDYYARITA